MMKVAEINTYMSGKFTSSKLYDGFSACFRQWKADGTHCQKLHGYGISFRVWFTGELDEKNWLVDFGRAKRSLALIDGIQAKDYFNWLLDHTVIVAEDDPELEWFKEADRRGIMQLRILPSVGCERFAEFLFHKIDAWVKEDSNNRCQVFKVEVYEHEKNSASYQTN